jgi:hypothetical protein
MKFFIFILLITLFNSSCRHNDSVVDQPPPEALNNGWEYSTDQEFPKVDHGFTNNIEEIYFINANLGFATGSTSILRTLDKGNTWTEVIDFYSKIYTTYSKDSIYIIEEQSFKKCSNNPIKFNEPSLLPEKFLTIKNFTVENNVITILGYGKTTNYLELTSYDYGNTWNRRSLNYFDVCNAFCYSRTLSVNPNSNIHLFVNNDDSYSTTTKYYSFVTISEYYYLSSINTISFRGIDDFLLKCSYTHEGKVFIGGRHKNKYCILSKDY